MRQGEGNLGFASPTGLDVGLWTGSRHVFADSADAAPDSIAARVDFVTFRAEAYLDEDWRVVVKSLRSPAMTEQIVAQIFGGAMPDSGPALGQVSGVVALSRTLERVALQLSEFVGHVWNARTWADLDAAAHEFAAIIEEVGPEAAFRIVTLGKGPVASSVSDAFNLGTGGDIVGEDVIREYMSTGGGSAGDARQRFSKGMKSNVRRNIRQTLEFLSESDAADPLEDDGPNAAALEILSEMNLDGEVTCEELPRESILMKTSDGRTGAWYVFQGTTVRSAFKPSYYKVKGTVVAMSSVGSIGDSARQLFVPRSMMGALMHLSAGIDPPAPKPTPPEKKSSKKDETTGDKSKGKKTPPGGLNKPESVKLSKGDEAGTLKGVVKPPTGKGPAFGGGNSIRVNKPI